MAPAELAIILVSHDSREFLPRAISSLREHTGALGVEFIVIDNGSDGAGEAIAAESSDVRVISCENRGFGHANNLGLRDTEAPFVLFVNPDTEVVEGSLDALVAMLRDDPRKGLIGCRELHEKRGLVPTIRAFPGPFREAVEALGLGGRRLAGRSLGERELDPRVYEGPWQCDWVPGSFMLARRGSIDQVGPFDERFFLYSEEIDLCLRLTRAGFEIWYMPAITFLHRQGHDSHNPRLEAQLAFARIQYARKHFGPVKRLAFRVALASRYALRAGVASLLPRWRPKRELYGAGLRAALGLGPPPFGDLDE